MKTHLAVVSESFMENAERSSRPRASGVIARVVYEEEEAPSSLVERACDSDHCDSCDAYRERLCANLYSSRPPAPLPAGVREHMPSVDDLDWGRDEGELVLSSEPSPFTLRSPTLALEEDLALELDLVDAAVVVVAATVSAPREMMHFATCEGDSCQSCGAYGDRLCSLLYGV